MSLISVFYYIALSIIQKVKWCHLYSLKKKKRKRKGSTHNSVWTSGHTMFLKGQMVIICCDSNENPNWMSVPLFSGQTISGAEEWMNKPPNYLICSLSPPSPLPTLFRWMGSNWTDGFYLYDIQNLRCSHSNRKFSDL